MSSKEIEGAQPDRSDWSNVGRYLRQATVETVHKMGGHVNDSGVIELPEGADENLLHGQESGFSEEKYAAIAEAFISRVEQIQEEARPKQERDSFVSKIFRR